MAAAVTEMNSNLRLLAPTIVGIQAVKYQFWDSQSQTTASSTGSKTTKAISAGSSTKDASSADTSSIAVDIISTNSEKLKAAALPLLPSLSFRSEG